VKEITPFAWLPGRIIGRYIDFFIPLIIVIGYLGLMRNDKEKAFLLAKEWDYNSTDKKIPIGIFYQEKRKTLEENF